MRHHRIGAKVSEGVCIVKTTSIRIVQLAALTLLVLGAHPLPLLHADETFILPAGRVGVAYEFRIPTEGGLAPLKWKMVSGELPPGIELLPPGTLQGVPTTPRAAAYEFVIEVSDSSQPPQTFAQRFSLVVAAVSLRMALGANPPPTETPSSLRIVSDAPGKSLEASPRPGGSNAAKPDTGKVPPTGGSEAENPSDGNDQPAGADRTEITKPLRQWDYLVSGKMPKKPAAKELRIDVEVDNVVVDLADNDIANRNTIKDKKNGKFAIWLKQALVKGQKVQARQVVDGTPGDWSDVVRVEEAEDEEGENCPRAFLDCRDTFEATAYIGLGIDTFASGETRKYLNPDAPNGPKERMVGGFDFAYRLAGRPTVRFGDSNFSIRGQQLWVYGETVHGVRSTDINCEENKTFLTCQKSGISVPGRPAEQILFTLRNATSLEAFAGLRWEFLTLQTRSISPANVYLKAQAGFLTVSGSADDVKDIHHIGLGAITTKGVFQGSYLEVGFGRTDLFAEKSKDRWKVDGFLSRYIGKGVSFFAQMTVDADVGSGSDSVQTYIGFDFDLRRFRDWFK